MYVLEKFRNIINIKKETEKIGCNNSETSLWEDQSNEKNPIKIGWKMKI